MPLKQKGFTTPLVVAIFAVVLISAIIPIKRNFNDGKALENVKGVEAKMKNDVKIATDGGAFINERSAALSSFPLSINSKTGELTVTTPAGSKVVTVLPQAAIDNMLAGKVMDYVIGEKATNELASIPSLIKLEVEDGVLGYRITGIKIHKLLGFIPFKTSVEAFVSAENGQVVTSRTSLLGRILNRIAP